MNTMVTYYRRTNLISLDVFCPACLAEAPAHLRQAHQENEQGLRVAHQGSNRKCDVCRDQKSSMPSTYDAARAADEQRGSVKRGSWLANRIAATVGKDKGAA